MTPKISIVMPVYNVEKYLRECLDSVQAQTFKDWECICVDDGSTDASPAILEEYAAKDDRFRVIRREHSNAGAARNVGMDMARGKYLSFLDSDDVFAPKMLDVMVGFSKRMNSDVVICNHCDFLETNLPESVFDEVNGMCGQTLISNPAVTVDIFAKWMGWAWDKLFKRSQMEQFEFRFQECPANNDLSFVFSMLSTAKTIVELRATLVAHRRHSQSIEGHVGYDNPWCVCEALAHFNRQMQRVGTFKTYEPLLRNYLNYAIRFSVARMCVAKTYKEFCLVYKSFRVLMTELDIGHYDKSWFLDERDLHDWCLEHLVNNDDYGAFRALFLTLLKTRREIKTELRSLKQSRAFKVIKLASKIRCKMLAVFTKR